jgi:thiamine biosynthesis lipoprotein
MAGQLMPGSAAAALPGRHHWRLAAADGIAIAERDALGTTARLVVWPASALAAAVEAVDRELDRLDRAASRFRTDSEISLLHAAKGRPVQVSAELAEAIGVALAAAEWSGGLTDPTVGAALIALGYDRDFAEVRQRRWVHDGWRQPCSSGSPWDSVRLVGRTVQLPADVVLDLGATAKGLGADWSADAALRASGSGGVVVSLGGDLATAGEAPRGGWPVLVADDHRRAGSSATARLASQVVRLARGGLATSSIACRQWVRSGRRLHHVIDPRTGLPAAGPWRTVSVVAATCADANAASTAAIVAGSEAPQWLQAHDISARLVGRDGTVLHVGGWPSCDGGVLQAPQERWLQVPGGQRGQS